MTTLDRFWEKVDKTEECWTWTAAQNGDGYGAFWTGEKVQSAHRFIFELETGMRTGSGMEIDHLCRNRACVRVDHMELVTREENRKRGELSEKRAAYSASLTSCKHGHPLDYVKPDGNRGCRTCRNRKSRAHHAIVRDNKPTRQEREYLRKVNQHGF